ncbi:MAG: TusE/DsrC/DsvC family sulfur relay protein [Oleiphilaceae bacterium]
MNKGYSPKKLDLNEIERVPMQPVSVDDQGFLLDLNDWNEPLAENIAHSEGITLTADHWDVIFLLRAFYQDYDISPAMRILVKQTKLKLGEDKGNSHYLLSLFPGSPAKIASKIAGLPKPINCL